jgi:hypothetical protein
MRILLLLVCVLSLSQAITAWPWSGVNQRGNYWESYADGSYYYANRDGSHYYQDSDGSYAYDSGGDGD